MIINIIFLICLIIGLCIMNIKEVLYVSDVRDAVGILIVLISVFTRLGIFIGESIY